MPLRGGNFAPRTFSAVEFVWVRHYKRRVSSLNLQSKNRHRTAIGLVAICLVGLTSALVLLQTISVAQTDGLTNAPAKSVSTNAVLSSQPSAAPRLDTNTWVWISPGTFVMGSPETETDRTIWEGPQTTVTLSKGFWMCRYEVNQQEYQEIMGNNPSYYKNGSKMLPVERVMWGNAVEYCKRLTVKMRKAGTLPEGWEFRLPTEAEWEFACRAGTRTRFSYGDDPGYANLSKYAWYDGTSDASTHEVNSKVKKPNAWGLYDMHGNVWEWCQDWWSSRLPSGSVTDPTGPAEGDMKVVRGGRGSTSLTSTYRSAYRFRAIPDGFNSNVGFRLVVATTRP